MLDPLRTAKALAHAVRVKQIKKEKRVNPLFAAAHFQPCFSLGHRKRLTLLLLWFHDCTLTYYHIESLFLFINKDKKENKEFRLHINNTYPSLYSPYNPPSSICTEFHLLFFRQTMPPALLSRADSGTQTFSRLYILIRPPVFSSIPSYRR